MDLFWKMMEPPVGRLKLVASDAGLVAILWENDRPGRVKLGEVSREDGHPVLLEPLPESSQGLRAAWR